MGIKRTALAFGLSSVLVLSPVSIGKFKPQSDVLAAEKAKKANSKNSRTNAKTIPVNQASSKLHLGEEAEIDNGLFIRLVAVATSLKDNDEPVAALFTIRDEKKKDGSRKPLDDALSVQNGATESYFARGTEYSIKCILEKNSNPGPDVRKGFGANIYVTY